jgi:hypothetical protein
MLTDLQSAPDRHPNPPQARSSGAERMARHRQRRRNGLQCVCVELMDLEVDQLIRCRLLDANDRGDPVAVRRALHGLLDQTFRLPMLAYR